MTRIRLTKKIPPAFSLDIDLHPAAGTTALFGPAGAGKTLILEMTAGLVPPDAGRILLDEAILYDAETGIHLPPDRRGCGYVTEQDSLFPHMTLRQNVAFAARRYTRLERLRRVAEILERCGIAGDASACPRETGADIRLRCAIARALVGEPRLLLLDDAGVDEGTLRMIRGIYTGSIVMVTADLDLCCAAVDEVSILDAGRIVDRGAPRRVFDQPESVGAARILGIPNLFHGSIAVLDPSRNLSRLELETFSLSLPYLPGHFKGDRVSVAVRPADLRVHAGKDPSGNNFVRVPLVRVSERTQTVRLEFAGSVFVDISREEYRRQRDNKDWQVEFPPESLRIL